MFNKSESPVTSYVTPVLLGILIVLNVFGLYLLMGNSVSFQKNADPVGIRKAILDVEYAKVGGKANYDVVNQATLIQIKEQIPQMEQYIKTQGGKVADTQQPSANAILSQEEIATILSGASIEGSKSADIVAIEYSDMECPFCIKQYSETKLQPSLAAQYGDTVAFAFKNSRGVNHSGTEAKALAALCAKEVSGDKAYISFYHAIMDGTTQSVVYPVAKLADITKSLKINQTKWQSCVDSKSTLPQFEAESAEAQKYGLSGTPGTLLINVKTGKYTVVEGAYPFSEFTRKIESIK